ncbi:hypothetical protein JXM67_06245 [candidate division WOR-3 bacterium]|nr:hypothetical protein [candidate division WOR-3 bacterium]
MAETYPGIFTGIIRNSYRRIAYMTGDETQVLLTTNNIFTLEEVCEAVGNSRISYVIHHGFLQDERNLSGLIMPHQIIVSKENADRAREKISLIVRGKTQFPEES